MDKFGFLFEDGTVTEKDLEYIHSTPRPMQRMACIEFGKTRDYLTAPSPECTGLKMFYKWLGAEIDNERSDTYEPFNRVRNKIHDIYDIVLNVNVRDLLVRIVMQDVHTVNLLRDSALIPLFKVVQNNQDEQIKMLILTEIIPFKLDDFHMTANHPVVEKNDNALLSLWEHMLEMCYMLKFDKFAKELLQFSVIIGIPRDIVGEFGRAVANDGLDPDRSAWFSVELTEQEEELEELKSMPLALVTEGLKKFFQKYSENGFSYDEFNETFRDKWPKILEELGIDNCNPEDMQAEHVSQEAIFMIYKMDDVEGIYPFVTVRDSLPIVLYGNAYYAAVEFKADKKYLLFIPIERNSDGNEVYYAYDIDNEECEYMVVNPFD